jgi:hypothetical protein
LSAEPALARIQARQIRESDVSAVVDLLARGFPERPIEFWRGVFVFLSKRQVPADFAKYGYLLESGGRVVGGVLLIFSSFGSAGAIRCNVSSWFVEPAFRGYGSLLACVALGKKNVTYLNITPAPHTHKTLLAQGYLQYSKGTFVAFPALKSYDGAAKVRILPADIAPLTCGSAVERELLLDHAEYGCLSFWCHADDGVYPFIFRKRLMKGFIPAAQLIYARDIDEFVRVAGPVGRFLAARGGPLVIMDANGPVPGLLGKYFCLKQPKYFKGPHRPSLGDLVHTEVAMFGI